MANHERKQQAENEAQKIASGQKWNEEHDFTSSVNNTEDTQSYTNEQNNTNQ